MPFNVFNCPVGANFSQYELKALKLSNNINNQKEVSFKGEQKTGTIDKCLEIQGRALLKNVGSDDLVSKKAAYSKAIATLEKEAYRTNNPFENEAFGYMKDCLSVDSGIGVFGVRYPDKFLIHNMQDFAKSGVGTIYFADVSQARQSVLDGLYEGNISYEEAYAKLTAEDEGETSKLLDPDKYINIALSAKENNIKCIATKVYLGKDKAREFKPVAVGKDGLQEGKKYILLKSPIYGNTAPETLSDKYKITVLSTRIGKAVDRPEDGEQDSFNTNGPLANLVVSNETWKMNTPSIETYENTKKKFGIDN